jgi:hypothetical protein
MDPTHQGDTLHDMDIGLQPLRQGKPVDTGHKPATEGKKLRQYAAALFGKNQGCPNSVCASVTLLADSSGRAV